MKIYLLFICVLHGVLAKHFRGGYVSWKPTGNEREVELFFRLAYKHGFFSDPATAEDGEDCTYESIRDKTPVQTGGEFNVITTYMEDGTRRERDTELFDGEPPYYTCTNIGDSGNDPDLHWASGYNRTIITLPPQESLVWSVGYDACCWVNTLVNFQSPRTWRLRTKIDLSPRSDLDGRANTSPYVEGLPMKTVAQDCITSIPINAIDKDGDRVKCRWTSENKGECESPNCGNPDPMIFEMKQSTCKIQVNAQDAETGLYAVAVIIEDYPDGRRRRQPFSKIPYQFLVNIQRRDVECNRVVTEIPEHVCYAVPMVINPPFKITLRAETTDPSVPIESIDMITQPGMEVSNLVNDGNGRYHVDVLWTPPADKDGAVEQLCYQAVDQDNIAGQEFCIQLFVGGSVPEPIPWLSVPSSKEDEKVKYDNYQWDLFFTEKIKLGGDDHSASVTFLFLNGTEAYSIILKETVVTNLSMEEPYFVSFETPEFALTPNTTYIIRLDSGAVVGTKGCHLPSKKAEWNFTTEVFKRAILRLVDTFPDGVTVECQPTFMIAYIERDLLPDIDPSILSYEDPNCYGTVHNETHLAVGTMYGKCGTHTIVNEDQSRVSMINTLFLPPVGTFVYGSVSTRSHNVEVRVNCSIPARRVAYVEFNTNSTNHVIYKEDVGESAHSLKMYPNESYRKPYRVWDFPIDVQQNERLYFEARTFTNRDLSPFLRECVATPIEDPRSSFNYTIIREGCAVDDTIQFHEASTNRIRFSIEAFSFIGYNLQSSVFVHCDIRDCYVGNGSCDTSCPEQESDPNLSKRSVSGIETRDQNTDGPIRILAEMKGEPDGFSKGEIILTCLVCVAIVMVMLLSYLVLMVTRQTTSTACAHCSQKAKKSKLALISTKSKI